MALCQAEMKSSDSVNKRLLTHHLGHYLAGGFLNRPKGNGEKNGMGGWGAFIGRIKGAQFILVHKEAHKLIRHA